MFVHLGGDLVIKAQRIIAILDHESGETSSENRAFMKENEEQGLTQNVTADPAKSIVVTEDTVYLSPISSHTLRRRAENMTFAGNEEESIR